MGRGWGLNGLLSHTFVRTEIGNVVLKCGYGPTVTRQKMPPASTGFSQYAADSDFHQV